MLDLHRQDFDLLDKDGSGVLGLEEVQLLLETQLQRHATEAEAATFLQAVDTNESGKVSLEQYIRAIVGGPWTLCRDQEKLEEEP